ncbi:MAG: cation diffusion facilitator family transporter, partial [Candidatus Competibacter sp.]|nr:cation diffusion facilitator family transporter [Candidatus Competibacter sp.]
MNDVVHSSVDPAQAARLLRLATYASVAVATTLIAAKLAAALLTQSVSVLASLVDSMMDVAASVINLLAVHYSLQPPDRDHRFGHGKAEPLAGLAQAAFIAGSAVFLILHAIDRLLHPQPVASAAIGI